MSIRQNGRERCLLRRWIESMRVMRMIYLAIFALSAVMSRIVRDVANYPGWAIAPDSARHMHEKAVPRLDGIAILGSVVLVVTISAGDCRGGGVQAHGRRQRCLNATPWLHRRVYSGAFTVDR